MNSHRELVVSYVMSCLPEIWVTIVGIDIGGVSAGPDTNVIAWIKSLGEGIYEDLDLAMGGEFLCKAFGVEYSQELWMQLFEIDPESRRKWIQSGTYEPSVTIRGLAEWIVSQTDIKNFEPVNIAGKNCGPAGAFLAIRQLASESKPGIQIAPSHPLQWHLDGRELRQFWNRLRMQTAGGVPPLKYPYRYFTSGALLAGILLSIISAAMLTIDWMFGGVLLVACLMFILAWKCEWTVRLPETITTFRDLSKHISASLAERIQAYGQISNRSL